MTPAEFMRAYEAAANAHDLEAVLDLIADDAIFLFSNESSLFGKEAIRKAITANFQAIKNESYKIEGLTWPAVSEQLAVCVYEFHWSGEVNGERASGRGRGTTVLRRSGSAWQIAHEHLSKGALRSAAR